MIIFDLSDDTSAAALAMAVNASGSVRTKTTVPITAELIDEAAKKHATYRPPGT